MKPDKDRVLQALDKAYDDMVSKLFDTYTANLIEATARNPVSGSFTEEQSLSVFIRGMQVAGTAYSRSQDAASKIG